MCYNIKIYQNKKNRRSKTKVYQTCFKLGTNEPNE